MSNVMKVQSNYITMQIYNKSFQNISEFKFLGTKVTHRSEKAEMHMIHPDSLSHKLLRR